MIDYTALPTPCYVVDEALVIKNLEILKSVSDSTGCKILLAQKGFSMYALYPLIGQYLAGAASSSLFEARLAREEMGSQVHIFSPAYDERDFDEIANICDHIVFNSPEQAQRFLGQAKCASCGLRINPEYSEIDVELYNPCAKGSRLGSTAESIKGYDFSGIEGLHFHTMCEQGADVLSRTVEVFLDEFGHILKGMKWLNLGGGHHITRPGYDVKLLISVINNIRQAYGVEVYLEPGEAIALNTGFLAAKVMDTLNNGMDIAILDASAACHMPDVLEMPYRPEIIGAGRPGEKPYTYRLGGNTCLAGDIIGDYSFETPLKSGDILVFCDMAHYTMVKNNTFNGLNLPAIALWGDGKIKHLKTFGYEDFKSRL